MLDGVIPCNDPQAVKTSLALGNWEVEQLRGVPPLESLDHLQNLAAQTVGWLAGNESAAFGKLGHLLELAPPEQRPDKLLFVGPGDVYAAIEAPVAMIRFERREDDPDPPPAAWMQYLCLLDGVAVEAGISIPVKSSDGEERRLSLDFYLLKDGTHWVLHKTGSRPLDLYHGYDPRTIYKVLMTGGPFGVAVTSREISD